MSFILDALRKSEIERQRQSGPSIAEFPVAREDRRLPIALIAIGALLALNVAAVSISCCATPAGRAAVPTAQRRPWRQPRPARGGALAALPAVVSSSRSPWRRKRSCEPPAVLRAARDAGARAPDPTLLPDAGPDVAYYSASRRRFRRSPPTAACRSSRSTCIFTDDPAKRGVHQRRRYTQGARIAEGPMVEEITADASCLPIAGGGSSCRASRATATMEVAVQPVLALGGVELAAALRTGIHRLIAREEVINKINVFPVPDGDTGTNLALTLQAVLSALRAGPEPHAGQLLTRVADAALDGARGNSGAILAQFLLGVGDRAAASPALTAAGSLTRWPVARITRANRAPSRRRTILTVADFAQAARAAARGASISVPFPRGDARTPSLEARRRETRDAATRERGGCRRSASSAWQASST
jgi:hypothetical protein